MLGKLFKYEFRAEGRILVPVYGATVLLSVISSIMSRFMYGDMTSFTAVRILSLCLTVLFGLLVAATVVMSFAASVMRFKTGMLDAEGYVTHTLPVQPWQNVAAKVLCSVVYQVIAMFVIAVSAFVFTVIAAGGIDIDFADLGKLFSFLLQKFGGANIALYTAEGIVFTLLTLIQTNTMFYASLSCGHAFNSGKIAKSIGFFIGFYVLSQFINGSILTALYATGVTSYTTPHLAFLGLICLQLFYSTLYFLVTSHCMKNRLNLQ